MRHARLDGLLHQPIRALQEIVVLEEGFGLCGEEQGFAEGAGAGLEVGVARVGEEVRFVEVDVRVGEGGEEGAGCAGDDALRRRVWRNGGGGGRGEGGGGGGEGTRSWGCEWRGGR